MENVKITEAVYDRVYDEKNEQNENYDMGNFVKIVLKIDNSQGYRIFDEFSDHEVLKNSKESFTIMLCYPEDEWVYGYILSFGHYAEVLEPPHIRAIIMERLKKSLEKYL